MLCNYEERRLYWSTRWTDVKQGDSLACPFIEYISLFSGKDVLEIGPGEGRQFKHVYPIARKYAIADITEEVLKQPQYKKIPKHLITDFYDTDLKTRFDVIHFWYVLHHVPTYELGDLAKFLYLHLREKGKVLFNTPVLTYDDKCYGDDGCLTAPHKIEDVISRFSAFFTCLTIDGNQYKNSNGYIYIGEKRNVW